MGPAWAIAAASAGGAAAGPALEWVARHVPVADEQSKGSRLPVGRRTRIGYGLAAAVVTGCVEGLTAWRLGATWAGLGLLVFFAGLLALAWSDVRRFLLPKRLLYPTLLASGAILIVASGVSGHWYRLGTAAACGAVAFALFLVPNLINPRGLAFGDVRLAGAIGLVAGWFSVRCAVEAIVLGTVLGALGGLALLAVRPSALRTHLPYGLFLAAGTVVALLISAPGALK